MAHEYLVHQITCHARWRGMRMASLATAQERLKRLRLDPTDGMERIMARCDMEAASRRRTYEKQALAEIRRELAWLK